MVESLLVALGSLGDPLGWVVIAAFLVAVAVEYVDRERSRLPFALAWVIFAAFWLVHIYPFFVEDNSVIRGVGAVVAVPLSLLLARALSEGRDSLFVLSRAVAFMTFIYAPLFLLSGLQEQLILLVTSHTEWAISLLGFQPEVVVDLSEVGVDRDIAGKERAYENTFVFFHEGEAITYSIVLACTGIGSMAVVAGLVGAVSAPLSRKLRALAVALPVIYVLNIVRNVFIAVSFGNQYMDIAPDLTMTLFSIGHPFLVSYIWADRIVAQTLAVVAMVAIIWLVVRELPEVMQPLEDVLYLLTGEEYDLAEALDVNQPDTQAESG